MDQLIISDTGFPLDNETLRRLQDGYRPPFEAVAAAMGDFTIVKGVINNGTTITAGWAVFNGELLPVLAGASQPNLELLVEVVTLNYDNGSTTALPAYERRVLRPAPSNGTPLSQFRRLNPLRDTGNLTFIGRVSTVFVPQSANASANVSYGGILNFERIVQSGRVWFKVTIPDPGSDYVPLVNKANYGVGSNSLPFLITTVTRTSFLIVPLDVANTDFYSDQFTINIIQ